MSDLTPRKQEHDYTKECDDLFSSLSSSSDSHTAQIERLLAFEKQTRSAADLSSTSRVLIKIVELAHDAGDWEGVNVQTSALSRKHGQLREATRRMVDRVMEYLPELEKAGDEEKRLKLIETLRDVTEGKVVCCCLYSRYRLGGPSSSFRHYVDMTQN